MNIGMILDSTFPPDPRVENEAVTLIKKGHSVFLYCFDWDHDLPEKETINGIQVRRVRLPRRLYSLSALAYTIPYYHNALQAGISDFITENNIESIHIHDMQIARAVFRANKKHQLPTVLDLHENRPEIMKYYGHVKSFLGRLSIFPAIWKKYEYRYIKQADKVITVTKEARDYYVERIPVSADKFAVVPNTVRHAFYTDYDLNQDIINRYKDNFTILYVGDTGLRRGTETIIKSLKYLIPKVPNIKLVLVGNSISDPVLVKLIDELGYEKYVDLEGWQNFKLFQSYIMASDLCTSPIHKNIHHETTYANKIFQYMSLGRPIIVSDCLAQEDVVIQHDCGLVFKDQNVADFADKVLMLHDDDDLRRRTSENAAKAVKTTLNWETTSIELTNLYDSTRPK